MIKYAVINESTDTLVRYNIHEKQRAIELINTLINNRSNQDMNSNKFLLCEIKESHQELVTMKVKRDVKKFNKDNNLPW